MIFSSRAKKIGSKKIIFSIISIYSSIPFLIIFHIMGILLFILPVSYLLSCNKYNLMNFIGFDRYKLPQLSFIDKLNCLYCSYANGLSTYYKFKVKELYLFDGEISQIATIIIYILYPLFYLSTQFYRFHSTFTYNKIVFPIISHHPVSMKEIIKQRIINKKPLRAKNNIIRSLLRKERLFSIVLADGLSAIETYWCPLKNHQENIIYPAHHHYFYDPEDERDIIKLIKDLT